MNTSLAISRCGCQETTVNTLGHVGFERDSPILRDAWFICCGACVRLYRVLFYVIPNVLLDFAARTG